MGSAGRESMLTAARNARRELVSANKLLSGPQRESREAEIVSITRKLFALETSSDAALPAAFADALCSLRAVLDALQHDPHVPFASTEHAARALDAMFLSQHAKTPLRNVADRSDERPKNQSGAPRPGESVRPRRHTVMEMRPTETPASAVRLQAELDYVGETNFYAGFSNDIDWGGVFISTWQPLPVGTEVVLALRLPAGHKVEAPGRVVWVRGATEAAPGMGVAFRSLSDSDRSHINSFMQRRPPMFYEP